MAGHREEKERQTKEEEEEDRDRRKEEEEAEAAAAAAAAAGNDNDNPARQNPAARSSAWQAARQHDVKEAPAGELDVRGELPDARQDRAGAAPAPHEFAGRAVSKFFPGHGTFDGTVVGFNPAEQQNDGIERWTVKYSDGDIEDRTRQQLSEILQPETGQEQ